MIYHIKKDGKVFCSVGERDFVFRHINKQYSISQSKANKIPYDRLKKCCCPDCLKIYFDKLENQPVIVIK